MDLCVYHMSPLQSQPWLLDEWGAGRPRNICRDRLNLERKKDSYKTPGDTTRKWIQLFETTVLPRGSHYVILVGTDTGEHGRSKQILS